MKKTTILLIVFIVLFLASSALAFWFWKSYQKEKALPTLPSPQGGPTAEKSLLEARETGMAPSIAPTPPYYGYGKLTSYSYKLETTFPSLPKDLQVYKVVKQAYTKEQAQDLAKKFGFKDEPRVDEWGYYFSEGQTPQTQIREEPVSSTPPSIEPGGEPQEFTGRELSISKDGCLSYFDFSKQKGIIELVYPEGEELKPKAPAGVESKDEAKNIATGFLKDKGLLPEKFDLEIPEPYGRYSVIIYPKFNDYKIQAYGIYLEIVDQGAISSVSGCKVSLEDFQKYPIKTQDEVMKTDHIEYKIQNVELSYTTSYRYLEKEGKTEEYLQPIIVLKGKDNLGNDFSFEIPAVKSEYLESIPGETMPLPLKAE